MARGISTPRYARKRRCTPIRAPPASTPGNLSALIHEPSFKLAAGEAVFNKARVINTLGNRAVHGHRAIPFDDALKFQREGIRYDDLSEEDKDSWDALEWDEDGNVPNRVEAEAVNKWLFNKDTVDKVLEHLMTRGLKVAAGDRLGKTIVFAKNQAHAEYIAERFDANYPHHKGEFARVITFKTEYAQSLIDNFSNKEKAPHIAISVDMLDTGIDIPEVVNLVFFKLVRSKTKHRVLHRRYPTPEAKHEAVRRARARTGRHDLWPDQLRSTPQRRQGN